MNDEITDDTEDESDEQINDVMKAIEGAGYAPEPDENDDSGEATASDSVLPGPLRFLEDLQGSGKSLESYEGSAIAEAVGPEGSKGALHIARGVDGLSPIGAAHPVMDIGIGILILKAESRDAEPTDSKDLQKPEDGDDSDSRGEMLS